MKLAIKITKMILIPKWQSTTNDNMVRTDFNNSKYKLGGITIIIIKIIMWIILKLTIM